MKTVLVALVLTCKCVVIAAWRTLKELNSPLKIGFVENLEIVVEEFKSNLKKDIKKLGCNIPVGSILSVDKMVDGKLVREARLQILSHEFSDFETFTFYKVLILEGSFTHNQLTKVAGEIHEIESNYLDIALMFGRKNVAN